MPKPMQTGNRNSKKCRSRNAWTTNSSRQVSKRPTTSRIGLTRRTMMMPNERKSVSLRWLKNAIRSEAIQQEDAELQKKLWRWYYRAKDAEYEVDILVQKSTVRDLLKLAIAKGFFDTELLNLPIEFDDDQDDSDAPAPPLETTRKSHKKSPSQDDDNLPKQKGFWD